MTPEKIVSVLLVLGCSISPSLSIHARCQYYTSPSFRSFSHSPAVRKCCCHGEALESGEGCVPYSPPSDYIARINESFAVGVGFPNIFPKECNMTMVTDKWFISERGSLVVNAHQGDLAIVNYCIDDLLVKGRPSPRAVTCTHELRKNGALPISAFRTRTIGKCCPRDEHFSSESTECFKGAHSDMDETIPGAPNNTQLGFTGVPKCAEGFEQASYTFISNDHDYVKLVNNLSLLLVKMDEHCVTDQMMVDLGDYCLDYSWDISSNQSSVATALLCIPKQKPKSIPMTGALMTVLISFSCVALILTIIFLVALQAKGMLSHVPQIGLLAPRTHLTYVGTLLIGLIILVCSMKMDVAIDSASCWTAAAFLLFFLLSGYFWNTALCCESLLIVMRVGSPGWKRYFAHHCWAYGCPAFIVFVALVLDGNRRNLQCTTITTRIGKLACHISDPVAQALYFYLPVFITIIANIVILAFARHVRMSRLRRLELGAMHHHKRHGGSGGAGTGKTLNALEDGVEFRRPHSNNNSTKGSNSSISRFGLSTRETHMMWWESVCLAGWSGFMWAVEFAWFSIVSYYSSYEENWNYFLWYIPGVMNSLRGFGVFVTLIVLPKDSRHYLIELISNAWEKCGGKPFKRFLPPTRRSSTSTNTTATTSTTLSPSATTDKERISLSSSDTQLSSHNASMSELQENLKNSENTFSESVTRSGDISNPKLSHDKLAGRNHLVEAVIENSRQSQNFQKGNDTSGSLKKTKNRQPPKPPRKSVENLTKLKSDYPSSNKEDFSAANDEYQKAENHEVSLSPPSRSQSCASLNSGPPMLPSSPPPSIESSEKSAIEFSTEDISDIIGSEVNECDEEPGISNQEAGKGEDKSDKNGDNSDQEKGDPHLKENNPVLNNEKNSEEVSVMRDDDKKYSDEGNSLSCEEDKSENQDERSENLDTNITGSSLDNLNMNSEKSVSDNEDGESSIKTNQSQNVDKLNPQDSKLSNSDNQSNEKLIDKSGDET